MAAMQKPLPVVAVMLTGAGPEREAYARASLRCFREQTYTRRTLLVVNQGDYRVLGDDRNDDERELIVSPDLNPGEMWNEALAEIAIWREDYWVIGWDDDDWHHPSRIAAQMAHRREGCAVALRRRLLVDMTQGKVAVLDEPSGMAGTLLFPHLSGLKFPSMPREANNDFYQAFVSDGRHVVTDNPPDRWPGAALYVQLWHGRNNGGEEERKRLERVAHYDQVTAQHVSLLEEILPTYYGVRLQAREK